MDDEIKKDIQTQFQSLPPELKKAISSVDLSQKLQQVSKNNKLMVDQAGKLELETMFVLIGLEPLDDYVSNLVKNAGIEKNTALKVAHDVDELIFKNVREQLKSISAEMATAEIDQMKNEKALPKKEDVLAGIEEPSKIKNTEGSVSVSSLPSNKPGEMAPISLDKGVEIRPNMMPEIEPSMYHENISPVPNIIEAKMTGEVIVPQKEIRIEEKTKLPVVEKSVNSDPYKEPIN